MTEYEGRRFLSMSMMAVGVGVYWPGFAFAWFTETLLIGFELGTIGLLIILGGLYLWPEKPPVKEAAPK